MPLPLLFIFGGAVASAVGVGKSVKAGIDQKDANNTNERATRIVNRAKEDAEESRKRSGQAINDLGQRKIDVLNNTVMPFVENFEKIHNVELSNSKGLEELEKFKIDKQFFDELKEMGSMASSIAGGTAVLGGLVAGPALAVMGFIVGAKASANKDKAYENLAKAREFEEEMHTVRVLCNAIRLRANMFERLLIKLDAILTPLQYNLEELINNLGTDYSLYTDEQKNTVAAGLSTVVAIKAVLDTPILTEDGKLSSESKNIPNAVQKVLSNGIQ